MAALPRWARASRAQIAWLLYRAGAGITGLPGRYYGTGHSTLELCNTDLCYDTSRAEVYTTNMHCTIPHTTDCSMARATHAHHAALELHLHELVL
jgi:hypothetical protein